MHLRSASRDHFSYRRYFTYSQTLAKVRTPDGDTESSEILGSVLQCDTLASFLFIVALDHALRNAIDGDKEELKFALARLAEGFLPRPI